jgi:hypothetical protein
MIILLALLKLTRYTFTITHNAEEIGRLYAGDWAFFPWSNHDGAADIKITPSVSTSITLEYMLLTD